MATNLLLGYPHIPMNSVSTSFSRTASNLYPFPNLFGGNKTDLMYLDSAVTGDARFTFDVGASGLTADFVYLGRANLLQQASVETISFKANSTDDYGTATSIKELTSFNTSTLYGPAGDDYIEYFTESSAFRYWYVNYNSTAASEFPHAKLFFGKAFDPSLDPNAPATIYRVMDGGSRRRATYSFEFSWEGMPYAKAVEMYTEFYMKRRYGPILIFTTSWHDILMGNRVIFCRMTDMTLPPRVTDYCDVTANFEEMP
jgi:hypothetical protein